MSISTTLINGMKAIPGMQKDSCFSFVSRTGRCLVFFSILMGILFLTVSRDPRAFQHLIREDGPIEYGSAALWLVAALTACITFVLTKTRTTWFKVAYVLLIVFFIACCGEEISWGQRLLAFHGPEFITEANKQGETNIHDVGSISVFSNTFFLLTIIAFIVYPAMSLSHGRIRELILRENLPRVVFYSIVVYLVTVSVWLTIGIRFGTLGFHPFSLWGYYTQMDDETFEFFAAYSFFALALLDLQFKYQRSGSSS